MLVPLDLAFPLLTAAVMGRLLWQVKQTRNYPIVGVLVLLAAVDAEVLTGLARHDDSLQRQGVWAGLWLVAAMITIIGGRVIPFFTRRGLRRSGDVSPIVRLDQALLGGTVLVAVLQAYPVSSANSRRPVACRSSPGSASPPGICQTT